MALRREMEVRQLKVVESGKILDLEDVQRFFPILPPRQIGLTAPQRACDHRLIPAGVAARPQQ